MVCKIGNTAIKLNNLILRSLCKIGIRSVAYTHLDVYKRQIQEGAILEKVLPEVRTMELSALEDYLMQKLPQHN